MSSVGFGGTSGGVGTTTALDLLRELRAREAPSEATPAADPRAPFAELQRAWCAAWQRAARSFAAGAPAPETVVGAAVLELRVAEEPWCYPNLSREDVRALLQAVYLGELDVRLRDDGRVVLRSIAGDEP